MDKSKGSVDDSITTLDQISTIEDLIDNADKDLDDYIKGLCNQTNPTTPQLRVDTKATNQVPQAPLVSIDRIKNRINAVKEMFRGTPNNKTPTGTFLEPIVFVTADECRRVQIMTSKIFL